MKRSILAMLTPVILAKSLPHTRYGAGIQVTGTMKRSILATLAAVFLTAALAVTASAQWPTTCVELNDIVEAHLDNDHNVGIYQKTFGDQAEAACQNDHRDDVRSVFAWAIPAPAPEPTPAPEPSPTPESAANKPWHYDFSQDWRDAFIFSEAGVADAKAALIARCYTGGERPEFFVYFYWYGTEIPELSDREIRRLELIYRFHDKEDAVAGWWDAWRNEEGATFMVLDANKRVAFARQMMTSPGLHVRFTKSGHSTDFFFGEHSYNEHPVITVMRHCGKTV